MKQKRYFKTKSLMLSAAAITAFASPMAVIACGIGRQDPDHGGASGKKYSGITLRVGMRISEAPFYDKAFDAFSKTTGVSIQIEGATPSSYSGTVLTNSGLADVTLVEGETINIEAQESGWFAPFDMHDLLTSDKYNDFAYEGDYQKYALDKDLDPNSDEWTNTNVLHSAIISKSPNADLIGKYNYLPTQLGPRMIFGWKTDEGGDNLFDGKKDLKWYVPTKVDGNGVSVPKEGEHVEEVSFTGTTSADSPLIKADGTHYKNSEADVKAFLLNSARESQRKFNQQDYGWASLVSNDPKARLMATGEAGYRQRLYSVASTLLHSGYRLPDAAVLDYSEFSLPMIAAGDSSIDKIYSDSSKSSMVDVKGRKIISDARWVTGFDKSVQPVPGTNPWNLVKTHGYTVADVKVNGAMPDNWVKMYLGKYGYFTDGIVGTKTRIAAAEEVVPFGQKKTWFIYGQKWMQPNIMATTKTNQEHLDDKFVTLPTTFSDPGFDGYAVKSGLSGQKKDAAFALLRFMMNKQFQAEMAGTKTVPMFRKGSAILDKMAKSNFDRVASHMGFQAFGDDKSDIIKGMQDFYVRQSDHNVAPVLQVKSADMQWSDSAGDIDFAKFVKRLNEIAKQYINEKSLS